MKYVFERMDEPRKTDVRMCAYHVWEQSYRLLRVACGSGTAPLVFMAELKGQSHERIRSEEKLEEQAAYLKRVLEELLPEQVLISKYNSRQYLVLTVLPKDMCFEELERQLRHRFHKLAMRRTILEITKKPDGYA